MDMFRIAIPQHTIYEDEIFSKIYNYLIIYSMYTLFVAIFLACFLYHLSVNLVAPSLVRILFDCAIKILEMYFGIVFANLRTLDLNKSDICSDVNFIQMILYIYIYFRIHYLFIYLFIYICIITIKENKCSFIF